MNEDPTNEGGTVSLKSHHSPTTSKTKNTKIERALEEERVAWSKEIDLSRAIRRTVAKATRSSDATEE